MKTSSITRTIASFALAGTIATVGACAAGLPSFGASAVHAAGSPSITAIADASSVGVFLVAGQGFTPRSTATIVVRTTTGGTVLASIAVTPTANGAFVKTVSLAASCASPNAQQVMVSAVDAAQTVSNAYPLTLSSLLTLAQTQLAAASSALTTLLHSANPSLQDVVAMQAVVIADYARVVSARSASAC